MVFMVWLQRCISDCTSCSLLSILSAAASPSSFSKPSMSALHLLILSLLVASSLIFLSSSRFTAPPCSDSSASFWREFSTFFRVAAASALSDLSTRRSPSSWAAILASCCLRGSCSSSLALSVRSSSRSLFFSASYACRVLS
uniref:Uncharacterized protein n=1 Tax=Ixodes ricinus TaxID=34613 RepID=A0A6B0UTH7_IXORI